MPVVIQGGMGVGVSSWQLARAVSQAGGLGVVSGTALDTVLARRLQDGDPDGGLRRAIEAFPDPEIAAHVLHRYFVPGGRRPGQPYSPVPHLSLQPTKAALELAVLGNFVEVWLAKEGHDGPVGVNFLEKIQMATPAAAYGAMLAGVDYVLMGAGIPVEIPRLLDLLAQHSAATIAVHVEGSEATLSFEPALLMTTTLEPLKRPLFLAIVSAHVLASYLCREDSTRPDGFVIEGSTAGGHNAPPRGHVVLNDDGQPVYGPRDEADLAKVAATGLPFWLAGSYGTPAQVRAALDAGAAGVQVGTLFALSAESGMTQDVRDELLDQLRAGTLTVRTDPLASPTGFPFKVAALPGTLSDDAVYAERPRLCDLGYLRVPYARPDSSVGYRCPAEPTHMYLRKGGELADTVGRKCLCNSLTANIGLGQTRKTGYVEAPLVTLGGGLDGLAEMLDHSPDGWSAAEAVGWLLSRAS